jgi:hypothetical protein
MSRWSAAATGAAVYPEDRDLYSSANGRLRFRSGRVGRIRAVCAVSDSDLGIARTLVLTYRDAGRADQGQGGDRSTEESEQTDWKHQRYHWCELGEQSGDRRQFQDRFRARTG